MKGAVVSTRRGAVVSMVGRRRRSGSGGMRTQQRSCPQHLSGSATIATRTSDPSIHRPSLNPRCQSRSRRLSTCALSIVRYDRTRYRSTRDETECTRAVHGDSDELYFIFDWEVDDEPTIIIIKNV